MKFREKCWQCTDRSQQPLRPQVRLINNIDELSVGRGCMIHGFVASGLVCSKIIEIEEWVSRLPLGQ